MESSVSRRPARALRRTVAVAATAAIALSGSLLGASIASAAPATGTISDATFSWGLTDMAGGGSWVNGCNFLSAGINEVTGTSRAWTEADGLVKGTDGNVTVTKPDSAGVYSPITWASRCLTPAGVAATPAPATFTGNVVNFSNGTGTVASDGSTVIDWDGSFTAAFYGGLTTWIATDPTMTIDADGNGEVTATLSAKGVAGTEAVLATFDGSGADSDGFTATADYLGVPVVIAAPGTQQSTFNAATWGSFPQSFVDFQVLTGQSSFWYSSAATSDPTKIAKPVTFSYTVTGAPVDGQQDIDVVVPEKAVVAPEEGTFGWSFASTDAVSFGTATQAGSTFVAGGALNTVVVSDSRTGGTTPYSWSISGQASAFTSTAGSFSAGYLGWTPSVSNAGAGVNAGAAVTSTVSGGAGLATSATLASSTAAASAEIDAAVSLVIPTSTPAGNYTGTLTVTALG